jgi:hypothetical protein
MNGLHNTIELTEITQGDILFNENRNMVSLQPMYTLGVPNISHRWHQINIVLHTRCTKYKPQMAPNQYSTICQVNTYHIM